MTNITDGLNGCIGQAFFNSMYFNISDPRWDWEGFFEHEALKIVKHAKKAVGCLVVLVGPSASSLGHASGKMEFDWQDVYVVWKIAVGDPPTPVRWGTSRDGVDEPPQPLRAVWLATGGHHVLHDAYSRVGGAHVLHPDGGLGRGLECNPHFVYVLCIVAVVWGIEDLRRQLQLLRSFGPWNTKCISSVECRSRKANMISISLMKHSAIIQFLWGPYTFL